MKRIAITAFLAGLAASLAAQFIYPLALRDFGPMWAYAIAGAVGMTLGLVVWMLSWSCAPQRPRVDTPALSEAERDRQRRLIPYRPALEDEPEGGKMPTDRELNAADFLIFKPDDADEIQGKSIDRAIIDEPDTGALQEMWYTAFHKEVLPRPAPVEFAFVERFMLGLGHRRRGKSRIMTAPEPGDVWQFLYPPLWSTDDKWQVLSLIVNDAGQPRAVMAEARAEGAVLNCTFEWKAWCDHGPVLVYRKKA